MAQTIRFPNKAGKDFITELRENVENYFTEKHLSQYANFGMVIKTIALLGVYFGAYGLILSGIFQPWQMLLLCVVMGIGKSGIGFSIAHDAIHGAYSSKKWVNTLLGFSMNIIGGSAYVWKITHNFVHHTYTNIHGMDEDLEVTSLMRLAPTAKHKKIHRFQHLYFPLVYGLTTLSWVFSKDYKKMSQKEIGPYKNTGHAASEVVTLIISKAVYYTYTIVIPLLVLHIPVWQFLIGFLVMHMTAGIILGIVFQLAHVVEDIEYPAPDADGKMENAWAVHQMKTTSDFGRKNKLLNWYVGGLNFQVEHHLFTNICSVHYPAISEIVKHTAEKYNVPYNEHRTFRGAVRSHYNVLRYYGRNI